MNRFRKNVVCTALVLPLLFVVGAGAQDFSVDGSGNVDATSFSGDGFGLTSVPTTLTHDYFELECPTATTCVVFKECPADYEVSGGGLFINDNNQSLRSQVVLHQTYRQSPTQWTIEATNNSGETLGFGVTPECVLRPASPDEGALESEPRSVHYQLLMCPEGDHWQYIGRADVGQPHFCPHDGEQMVARGGRRYPVGDSGSAEDREADDSE